MRFQPSACPNVLEKDRSRGDAVARPGHEQAAILLLRERQKPAQHLPPQSLAAVLRQDLNLEGGEMFVVFRMLDSDLAEGQDF